ncbi:TNF receptor-associated factor 4-like [Montipora capricornis]|uniref:TNF receptor-associated factor 4-like n=1 Tax=Montipora capricornis TaxID=246305 RepID=UPI0035F1204C
MRENMVEVERSCALGGYDEEFVEDIEDDWLCPICHLPLKVSVLTEVCGHRFCKLCLERHFMRQEADGQELTCPLDQNVLTRDKDMFVDKATERKVRSFVIKCPRGCQWTGELRSKEDHKNECKRFPVNCPNGCGELVPREEILLHTENNCSLAPIPCPYAEMGCNEKVLQPEIKSHLHSEMGNHLDLVCARLKNTEEELWNTKDHLDLACTKLTNTETELQNTKEHLDLACTKLTNTETELQNTMEQFKEIKEITKKLHERIVALETKRCQESIYIWKINGFHRILEKAKTGKVDKIESDPFYTSEGGYKVTLRLYPNGHLSEKNTHLSIYLTIMKGDFDSILKWPFAKRVTFTLIDQQENANDRKNITRTIPGNQDKGAWNSRPLRESGVWKGLSAFVSHDVLMKRGYVQDDTIFIQAEFETLAP